MSTTSEQFAELLVQFENLIRYCATHPDRSSRIEVLRLNYEVHQGLTEHRHIRRSKYLTEAMRLLKDPLRQDLPIPWDFIKKLDELSVSQLQLVASKKRELKPVEQVPQVSMEEKGIDERMRKRRKVQDPRKRYVHIDNAEGQDDEEEVRVKMEEVRFDVACHQPSRGSPKSDHQEQSDVLRQKCENCIRWKQIECLKTGKRGACGFCASKRKGCSLTEAVRAHWVATGDPRGQSRSRSRGPRTKPRGAVGAVSVARPQSGEETKGSGDKQAPRGRSLGPRTKPRGAEGEVSMARLQSGEETKGAGEKRTTSERIDALQKTVQTLEQELQLKQERLCCLIDAVDARTAALDRMQQQLDQYEHEHRSLKVTVEQAMDIIRRHA